MVLSARSNLVQNDVTALAVEWAEGFVPELGAA